MNNIILEGESLSNIQRVLLSRSKNLNELFNVVSIIMDNYDKSNLLNYSFARITLASTFKDDIIYEAYCKMPEEWRILTSDDMVLDIKDNLVNPIRVRYIKYEILRFINKNFHNATVCSDSKFSIFNNDYRLIIDLFNIDDIDLRKNRNCIVFLKDYDKILLHICKLYSSKC